MFNKIFFKIGTVFTSIIVVYVLFISYVISPKISENMEQLSIKQAKTQLNRIETIIEERVSYLKTFEIERLEEHKRDIKSTVNIAKEIMNHSYELYNSGETSKEEAMEHSFELLSSIKNGYTNDYIFILDKKGNFLFHPDKELNGKNGFNLKDSTGKYFVQEIISESLKNKEAYTNYLWDKLDKKNELFEKITYSIYYQPLEMIICAGVYVEDINQDLEAEKTRIMFELSPLMRKITEENMGYVYGLNKDAKVVFHPDERVINSDYSKTFFDNKINKSAFELIKESYEKNIPFEHKWNRKDDFKNYIYDKISWVSYNKFFDWYLISSLHKDEIKEKSREINLMVLNLSIVVLIGLTLLAIIFIRKLLFPIIQLTKDTERVEKGDYTVRSKVNSSDELGVLSAHFNLMLDKINENTKELERKVEERTIQLNYKFYHDDLTGLENRNSLEKALKGKEFYALSLIDLKQFDEISELYGFSVGSEVVFQVSRVLDEFCRKKNVSLYKFNYDVFAILDFNSKEFISYEIFLDDIQNLFDKAFVMNTSDIELHLDVTIGTSFCQEEPIKTAGIALKKAKNTGGKYIAYSKAIDTKESIQKNMYWRNKIKDAIENDKIVPFFQPIFNKEKQIIKHETLMRIKDTSKDTFISPGEFLDISVKTGQYFKLNQMVIKKAFQSIDKLNGDISINISFIEISDVNFQSFIEREVELLSSTNRKRVVLEILESDFISDYKIFDAFIFKFRKKGLRIAIDDFGTGYSNFSHILKVKPDYLKIDGSLIQNIVNDNNSYKVVKSIVKFSKSLNIKIIAEFVSSKEIFEVLKKLEVEEYQGFYLGEPKPLI